MSITTTFFDFSRWRTCQISWKSVEPRPKYGDFSIFQDGCRRHLGFSKFQNFNGRDIQQGRIVSACQILSKSVERRPRYGYFQIFQHGGRRHLGFSKFEIFHGRNGQDGRTAPACQISWKSVEPRTKYGDFSIFLKWRLSAILDLQCVCVDHPRRIFGGLYHCAKFGRNRCSSFENMDVFRFREFGLKKSIHAPKLVFLTP